MSDEESKKAAHDYYKEAIGVLLESGHPFLIGGAFSLKQYTDVSRDTKDLDVFCKAIDCNRILKSFNEKGYKTELTDARWLAKAFKGDFFVDFIFNTTNNICAVDDQWFTSATEGELYGLPVKYISAEELIWCKIYVQNRERYDGADINHLILKYGHKLNWKKVWSRFEQHWQLLFGQILNFQFVYPSERDIIPKWLFDQLMVLAQEQYDIPAPMEKVCRGPLVDHTQYSTDIKDWNFKSLTIKTV